MKLAVAADHGGFTLKTPLIRALRAEGHSVLDLGTSSEERVDYPDFAKMAGEAVRAGDAERGIVVCGSGVGAAIAANKMRGIRASVCHDTYSAHQGVEHDDMNVLVLGGRVVGIELALDICRAFVGARFNNGERYVARLAKVAAMERDMCE